MPSLGASLIISGVIAILTKTAVTNRKIYFKGWPSRDRKPSVLEPMVRSFGLIATRGFRFLLHRSSCRKDHLTGFIAESATASIISPRSALEGKLKAETAVSLK
jgi:hypothetical protein